MDNYLTGFDLLAFPELWDWWTLRFIEVLPEPFQLEELCFMNFDFQQKFHKHLKKMCTLCLSQQTHFCFKKAEFNK